MDNSLKIEDVFIQIRDKLQKESVKLWLLPYYDSQKGPSEDDLQRLAADYARTLQLPQQSCFAALLELQSNALEKLKQRNRFKESGLATLKIKVLKQSGTPKVIVKEVPLTMIGEEFKKSIIDEIGVPLDQCKLISGGIVIKDLDTLGEQGIKNGSQVLAIILVESLSNIKEDENRVREIESTRADTFLLASDDGYMQLEDQHGNAINIPMKEKKALMVAMALHEKGRSALKKEDFAKALVFFLDADKEFSICNAQILNSVDNYALLDLDIAWCYLCLQSFVHLPEAYERLKRCEDRFHQTYGPNLERLLAVKGTTGNEAALLMRLHLMQAIVLYHQNKRTEAKQLLIRVEGELNKLKVDENSLLMLVELGYSIAESRLGLRATQGDVNMAANHINEIRTKRMESRNKAMAERILQRERKKLGLCIDGKQYVDPNYLKMLVNMGYGKEAARVALQKTNNIISDSIQYIQENPVPGPSNTKSQEILAFIEDLIPELEAAGFTYEMSKLALKKHSGDVMKAAEDLLINNGLIEGLEDLLDDDKNVQDKEQREKERKLKEEAFNRLCQDISIADDDHLDLNLLKEEVFLQQYLELLQSD
ncbi:NEDD8 ultimate buster 1-like [Onthophagus taurus]|uniref:NEDD8 ultimate buster 1-like n=1 Tax=Onthophagus taurus TaxID=166361 RepID=UPI0039BE4849